LRQKQSKKLDIYKVIKALYNTYDEESIKAEVKALQSGVNPAATPNASRIDHVAALLKELISKSLDDTKKAQIVSIAESDKAGLTEEHAKQLNEFSQFDVAKNFINIELLKKPLDELGFLDSLNAVYSLRRAAEKNTDLKNKSIRFKSWFKTALYVPYSAFRSIAGIFGVGKTSSFRKGDALITCDSPLVQSFDSTKSE